MMDMCSTCGHWTVAQITKYENGSTVENYRAPRGRGHCAILNIETAAEFGCLSHTAEAVAGHTQTETKPGAPWQHWVDGRCPDCAGAGSTNDRGCHRCAGTGKVRHYDDGHVGEERTRLHPKEVATKPKCAGCGRDVDPSWKACPACGRRTEAPADPQVVGDDVAPATGDQG